MNNTMFEKCCVTLNTGLSGAIKLSDNENDTVVEKEAKQLQ